MINLKVSISKKPETRLITNRTKNIMNSPLVDPLMSALLNAICEDIQMASIRKIQKSGLSKFLNVKKLLVITRTAFPSTIK
jgi:uncharacterized membrane protein